MGQENVQTNPTPEKLLSVLVEKAVDNGKAINEVSEVLRKLPDPKPALVELAKRMVEQESRMGKQTAAIDEIRSDLRQVMEKPPVWELPPPDASVLALRKEIAALQQFFQKPLKKEVQYRHFLGKPLWVLVPMLLLIGVLSAFLILVNQQANAHDENDVQWRYVKLTADSATLVLLEKAEDLYRDSPNGLRQEVKEEEERLQQLYENLSQVHRAEGKIQELEVRKKIQ